MKTLFYLFLLFLTIFGSGCNNQTVKGNKIDLTNFQKALSGDQALSQANNDFLTPELFQLMGNSGLIYVTDEIPDSRDDLEKMRMVIQMYDGDKDTGITIPGFGGLKLGKEESNVNVYYLESKVVTNGTDSVVYGCGYSMHYLFKKVKRGISIDNLPSVAASAQLNSNKTQVYFSIQSYGVYGINLVKYFKPTVNKNFNVEGFGLMQSSIDGIHHVLGDSILASSVKFTPEIIKFVKAYELEQTN